MQKVQSQSLAGPEHMSAIWAPPLETNLFFFFGTRKSKVCPRLSGFYLLIYLDTSSVLSPKKPLSAMPCVFGLQVLTINSVSTPIGQVGRNASPDDLIGGGEISICMSNASLAVAQNVLKHGVSSLNHLTTCTRTVPEKFTYNLPYCTKTQ